MNNWLSHRIHTHFHWLLPVSLLLFALNGFGQNRFENKDEFLRSLQDELQKPTEEDRFLPDVELHTFDTVEWKRLTEDLDYGELQEIEQEEESTSQPGKTNEGFANFMKYVLIIGGIILLAWILYQYFSGSDFGFGKGRKKTNSALEIAVENLEENLPSSELGGLLPQAETAGDYRMAARLRYLSVIQELNIREWVDWEKEKTNGQYLRELRSTQLYDPFRGLTILFERFWYGRERISQEEYQQLVREHDRMVAALQTAKAATP